MGNPPAKRLNIFQRIWRRLQSFRQHHPYWYIFTVGALVSTPPLIALGVMIMFPPATPVILAGAALLASHLGLAVSIPAFVGTALGAAAVVGGLFAGVKRGFDRLLGRQHHPVNVKKATPHRGRLSQPGLPSLVIHREPSETPTPPSPSATPASVASPVTLFSQKTLQEIVAKENQKKAKDCYKEASKRHEKKKQAIVAHLDQAMTWVQEIAELPKTVEGAFAHNTARTKLFNELKRIKGNLDLFSDYVLNPYLEQLKLTASPQVARIRGELNKVHKKKNASTYTRFEESLRKLARLDDETVRKEGSIHHTQQDKKKLEAALATIQANHKKEKQEIYAQFNQAEVEENAPRRGFRVSG